MKKNTNRKSLVNGKPYSEPTGGGEDLYPVFFLKIIPKKKLLTVDVFGMVK